jgi:hypothetical protein
VRSEYVISAGAIGKLLFCIQHIFLPTSTSSVFLPLQVPFLAHISYFLILNSFKIWAVAIAAPPKGVNRQDARAMEVVVRAVVTG